MAITSFACAIPSGWMAVSSVPAPEPVVVAGAFDEVTVTAAGAAGTFGVDLATGSAAGMGAFARAW